MGEDMLLLHFHIVNRPFLNQNISALSFPRVISIRKSA